MEISSAHHQAMATNSLEEVLGGCPMTTQQQQQERRVRPHPEQALSCPRCDSTNTKFCYYNNYSLSQPRYFCKGCRRYWTQGGTLRNVPVGGGCRKNKRSSSSSSKIRVQDQDLNTKSDNNPLIPSLIPPQPISPFAPGDLTLGFSSLYKQPPTNTQIGLDDHATFFIGNPNPNPNLNSSSSPTAPGFLEFLRSELIDGTIPRGLPDLCYGFVGNGMGEDCGEQGVLRFEGGQNGASTAEATVTTTNGQGSCKAMDGGENNAMMGHQWHSGLDSNFVLDTGRDYWNGMGSSFHGLINSSLM